MSRSWGFRAVVLLALTAVPLSALAGTAGAIAHSAVDTEKFCDAAMGVYDGSLRVDKNGAYADPAALAASARESAPYAPAKVRAAALSIAKVYADVAKVSGSQAQAQRYASLYAKAAKPTKIYFGYFGKTCVNLPTTGATSGASKSSGAGNLAVNLTVAAAGALPETKITGTKAPAICNITSVSDLDILIQPNEVTGLQASSDGGSGLAINGSLKIGLPVVGGGINSGNFRDSVEVTKDSAGNPTVRINSLPIGFGIAPDNTFTTISGTVTCPK